MEAEARQELIEERANPEGEGGPRTDTSARESESTESDPVSEGPGELVRGMELDKNEARGLAPDAPLNPSVAPSVPQSNPPAIED